MSWAVSTAALFFVLNEGIKRARSLMSIAMKGTCKPASANGNTKERAEYVRKNAQQHACVSVIFADAFNKLCKFYQNRNPPIKQSKCVPISPRTRYQYNVYINNCNILNEK